MTSVIATGLRGYRLFYCKYSSVRVGWRRCREGVGVMDELLIVCMVILQGLNLVLLLFLASRGTGLLLDLFEQLDLKIAGAITKLMNEGLLDVEPPNPIQALIASVMQQKMADIAPRNDAGQFVEIKAKVD